MAATHAVFADSIFRMYFQIHALTVAVNVISAGLCLIRIYGVAESVCIVDMNANIQL